ncbi:hypothetical protein BpHYR1_002832 [Brachionus plicatilis]|uniref:Uncharacterized protein n=1 Tax=Brachionus plicatilis TaxID=10195 RepID=A0A3M7P524_BRAPC|nr:hypothetical protein BpHYR1_002832 [Brachionus plicatilis]
MRKKLYLHYLSDSFKVNAYEHTNLDNSEKNVTRSTERTKYESNKKDDIIKLSQKDSKEKFGKTILSLGELEKCCDDMDSDEIENQDEVDEKDYLSLPFFRLFITTKRLLEFTLETDKINIDATYK